MAAYDVVEVSAPEHLKLHVRFADGLSGVVRFMPSHLYGVFEPLRNPTIFAQASCEQGFVSWPGEVDLSPDAMYQAIREKGEWLLA